jgi:3D (Asp-Asp-Asp) domain-containing protein
MKSAIIALVIALSPFNAINTQIDSQDTPSELVGANTATIQVYPVDQKTVITAYTLSEDETDGNPDIGSGNHNLKEMKPILAEKGISVCASRDLPLHTQIYIQGVGICEILDRLNIRYEGTGRIDLLMDSKKEARKWGAKELSYALIK